ncbi:MAG: PKD domain-containing protein [Crocinitomicaceae bacterium]|nr:PKD domain-containing protein [Crocinitomicaceae bacterium]
MKFLKYIVVILFLFKISFTSVNAQIDTVFWFAAPWVTPDHDGNTQMAFRVSTFNNPTNVRIQLPALGYDTTFLVPANSLADVPMSHKVLDIESKPADVILTSGFKITSDEKITVVYDFISDLINITPGTPNNPETYSLKGQNGMGVEFVTPFQTIWNNRDLTNDRNGDGVVTDPRQFFSVVATEDNTTIYIKPNCDVVGHPADITYSVVLPLAGNVYTCENVVMTTSNPGSSLSGSIVFSDKPVSITVNDDSVNPSGGGGCFDLMGDQIVPTDVIGNDYIINKGFLNTGSNESIFIIAAENFTTVTIDDGVATTQLMNQGETIQYSIDELLTSVRSDKPVYVVHMSGYGCELGMAILPPLNCAGSDEVSLSRNNAQQFLLNILCEAGDESSFSISPGPGTIPAGVFNPVPGMPGWVGTQIDYPVSDIGVGNQYTITNSAGFFSLGVINGGSTTGCLYHYLSSFYRKVITDAGADVTVCDGEPSINLSGSVTGGTTTGEWTILNGTGILNNPTNLITSYNPSPSDYAQGELTFVLSSTGNCEPITDTMEITFIQSPNAQAGSDSSYCKNNLTTIPIAGSVQFAAGGSWSGGSGGAFGNPGSLSTTYTPSPADLGQDSVVLFLTSAGSVFSCPNDVDSVIIYFTPSPLVNAGNDLVLCSSVNTIDLNGSISGATMSGEWSTSGSGAFSPTSQNPISTYNVSSNDTIGNSIQLYLSSTNNGGCLAESDSILITFLDPPAVNILSNDSICSNLSVLNLDGQISTGYTPTWSTNGLGNIVLPGNINTQYNISALDTTVGYIDVFLESNAGICPVINDSLRIHFIDPPTLNAGLDMEYCNNETVGLNGTISGQDTSVIWSTLGTGSFIPNDSTISASYSPSADDISNGSVNLILTSASVFGCPPVNDNVIVTFKPSPVANFSSTTVCLGNNTTFNDLSSASSGSIDSWDWDFGDAISSITANPIHTYSFADTIDVTLIVGESNGCYDTITLPVTVHPVPVADFEPTIVCENTPITFTDLSNISSGTINNWLYDFGTSVSAEQNPTYTYSNSGNQLVNLTVSSDLNCVDDTVMTLFVNPSPQAEFNFNPNPALVSENVNFFDASSGNVLTDWFWDFGDNEASNSINPVHNYDNGGAYTILLVVSDDKGCIDSLERIINIALPPVLPTGFTPNADGENDIFIIRGGPFKDVVFNIYDNWGELIFTSNDASIGWDGTYKGQNAPIGVYTWTFVVTLANDQIIKKSGDVTLMR